MSTKGIKAERCLLLNFRDLPSQLQQKIKGHHNFGNDRFIEFLSEFCPEEGQQWSDVLTEEAIVLYWQEQSNCNHYKGSLETFVDDYDLRFERWLLTLDPELLKVSTILIKICW